LYSYSQGSARHDSSELLGNHFGDRKVPVLEVADFCRTLVALTEVSNLPLTVSEKAQDWLEKSQNKDVKSDKLWQVIASRTSIFEE
jgi:hypothetical protein